MQLLINRMEIEDFKGIKYLVIDFSPTHTDISGANGSGKTTIADAFSWLLYGKDSKGNSAGSNNFNEKPLDDNGQEIHNLVTSVSIKAYLDGAPFDLKRIQQENWVRKRGAEEAVYSGNVSTYYINEVEVKQTDFRNRISEIVPEEVSRLVTTMGAFNQIEWKKRRELLLKMSGVDADAVLMQREEFHPIADFTGERNVSVEDMRKIFADRKRNIEQDLKLLPVRIDEAMRAIPAPSKYAISDLEKRQEAKKSEITAIDAKILAAKSDDPRETRNARMAKLQADKKQAESDISDAYTRAINLVTKVKNENAETQRGLEKRIEHTKNSIALLERQINTVESITNDWRIQYRDAYALTFAYKGNDVCPTCGQAIAKEILEKRIEDAKAKFDQEKNETLERITSQGKLEAEKLEAVKATYEEEKANLASLETQLPDAIRATETALEAFEKEVAFSLTERIATDANIQSLNAQIEALFNEPIDSKAEESIEKLNEHRSALNDELFAIGAELQAARHGKATKERIEQLRREMTSAGERLNEVEQTIALIERFVQERCGTLEGAINSLFPSVRWKLFDIQINGGINETCVCMIPCASGLIPYESANTASRFAADAEIIDVLSKHHNAYLPVFIDGTESLNVIPKMSSQLITLTVTTDKGLVVSHK